MFSFFNSFYFIYFKKKSQNQIQTAVEELFVNIAHYAYPGEIGYAEVRFEYIEKEGLICDGLAHGGTYGNNIYSLQNGIFHTIVETIAVWNMQEDSFLFYLNGEVVDSIHGNNVEDSCIVIQEQLHKVYYSKGESKSVTDNKKIFHPQSAIFFK